MSYDRWLKQIGDAIDSYKQRGEQPSPVKPAWASKVKVAQTVTVSKDTSTPGDDDTSTPVAVKVTTDSSTTPTAK